MKKKLILRYKGRKWHVDAPGREIFTRQWKGKPVNVILVKPKGVLSNALQQFNLENRMQSYRKIRGLNNVYELMFDEMSPAKLHDLTDAYYRTGLVDFAEVRFRQTVAMQPVPKKTNDFLEEIPLNAIDTNEAGEQWLNDEFYTQQWIFENEGPFLGPRIKDALMEISRRNDIRLDPDIIVAVLDQGVDTNHIEFQKAGLIRDPFYVIGSNQQPKNTNHHGTMIAGVISAIQNNQRGIAGINPYCKIMPGRIYYDNTANASKMAAGIYKALENHARVLNLSWAIPAETVVIDAISYAVEKGALIVAAAGNYEKTGKNNSVRFPGSLDEVLTVGAHDQYGKWINLSNSPSDNKFGSCFGREVDISAPGISISTTGNDNTFTHRFCGTSAAAAVVSAIAALVWAIKPDLPADEIKSILFSTADKVTDEGTPTYIFDRYGHGRVNCLNAVKKVLDL